MLTNNKQNNPVDVLQAFRSKNCGLHLPNPQASNHVASVDNTPDANHDSSTDNEDTNSDMRPMPKKCACHWTKDPNPQSLTYYPSGWKSVLIKAKRDWQYHVAITNPFPDREEHLDEVANILARAISEYEANGGILEDSVIILWRSASSTNDFLGYDQDRCMNILASTSVLDHVHGLSSKQVFNEAATWRGKMKDMAKNLILEPKAYGTALQPDDEFDGGHNSQDYEDTVAKNIRILLNDAVYLRDAKKDQEVCWVLLEDLIADMLYTGTNGEFSSFRIAWTLYSVLL